MRFAYIDSNGNEVPIPSVDALALRIELGAITESTQLYDAQADEWGPAHTHEIFHTLSRDAGDDDGFIAPPPVAPPTVEEPEGQDADVGTTPEEPGTDRPDAGPEAEAAETETVAESSEPEPAAGGEEDDGSFGLTLADPEPTEDEGGAVADADSRRPEVEEKEAEETLAGDAPSASDDLPYLDLDSPSDAEEEDPMDLTPSTRADEGAGGAFDFGGLEGELEVEEAFESSSEQPMEGAGGDDTTDPAAGMELETAREFDTGSYEGGGDELDLEAPMSQFSPDEPPSWMDESEADDGNVLDFSAAGAAPDDTGDDEAGEEVPLRKRRTPRTRPSPPRFKRDRNLAVPIIGIVLFLAVGIGGYVAWPIVSDRLSSSADAEEPAVFIPTLAPELVPVMRDASSSAFASIFETARTEWTASNPVQEPPSDWLAGVYLARAGEYESVELFWGGMSDFVERVRGIELAAFDAALAADLQARDLPEADAEAIRERADSGFVAAAPERAEVFDRFQRLIDAALDLHTFLVANEQNIEYAPASAVTTDPVLEVNPASEEIRAAMEDLLDQVTRSLAQLEYRDRVTAAGLRGMILSRVQERGVQ